jgi:hypothetical protein
MHTHDHPSAWLHDPRDNASLRLFEDVLEQENAQKEGCFSPLQGKMRVRRRLLPVGER